MKRRLKFAAVTLLAGLMFALGWLFEEITKDHEDAEPMPRPEPEPETESLWN